MSDLVEALFYMNNNTLGMGDSYQEFVEGLYERAFNKEIGIDEDNELYNEELDYFHKEALSKLLNTKGENEKFFKDSLEYYCEFDNEYFADVAALCGKTNKLLNALVILEKYSLVVLKKTYEIFNLIPFLKEHGEFIEKCSQIGNVYWEYLYRYLWGSQTNSSATIGEVLLNDDYQYVMYISTNKVDTPRVEYNVLLKNDITGLKVVIKEGNKIIKDFYPSGVTIIEIGREIGNSLNSILSKNDK